VATKEGSGSRILLEHRWGQGPRAAQRLPPLFGGSATLSADTAATFAGLAFADHLGLTETLVIRESENPQVLHRIPLMVCSMAMAAMGFQTSSPTSDFSVSNGTFGTASVAAGTSTGNARGGGAGAGAGAARTTGAAASSGLGSPEQILSTNSPRQAQRF